MPGLTNIHYTVGTNVTVSGSDIYVGKSHSSPAFKLEKDNWQPNDKIEISITVTQVQRKMQLWWGGAQVNPTSKTGLFVVKGSSMKLADGGATGSDVISWTNNSSGVHMQFDTVNNDGSTNNDLTCTFTINQITVNGKPLIEEDPYSPGGGSGTGGGNGNFDGTGDSIDFPNLPTLSAVSTGFISLFNPSVAQLLSLSNYMWSDAFSLDTFKRIFADPMECILGLSIVPVNVPSGGVAPVVVGNIPTDISMTKAASQYVTLDCGSLNVNEFWGAYLDYDPYTKAEIYLPYCGIHPLSVDDIMGKTVHVKYNIDILSGACCAMVKCGESVLYQFIGQCSSSIPITSSNWTNVINGVLSISGSIGSMVATGGASAPTSIGQIASTAVNSMKPNIAKSGSLSGTGGMMGVQTPYLILTRPRQALPTSQNTFTGYPAFITEQLKDLTGYTEIDSIHLENVPATESELSEIETLLKGGVIF